MFLLRDMLRLRNSEKLLEKSLLGHNIVGSPEVQIFLTLVNIFSMCSDIFDNAQIFKFIR